jgi:DNA-binding NarL/FixJ family response regulator
MMGAAPPKDAGSLRSDHRRELIVVDPRPLFAVGISAGFDAGEWQVHILAPDAVANVPIRAGVGVVALAEPDVAEVVGLLVARDRRVIVYGNDDGALFFEAVDAGAVGFVSDRAGASEFGRAATALRNGAPSVFPEHTRRRMSSRGWPAADNGLVELERLTRREREVLEGLVAGLSPSAIAERDFVSVITVRNQVQAILTKLNVHSQLEAVATVHRYGWMLHTA